MLMNKKIRLATEADSTSVLEIYAPFVKDTVISFEYEVPTVSEFSKRMDNIQKKYPWLICEVNDNIVGYAYASQFNGRAAYDWSVDFSIYIKPEYHKKKIGKALYTALSQLLRLQGYCNAYAGVTLPNIKSESLHESFGFKPVGVYHNVGFKFGNWYDVKWFELEIQEHFKIPINPKTINEIKNTPGFYAILQKAEKMIAD